MAPWGEGDAALPSGLPEDFILTVASAKFGFPFEESGEGKGEGKSDDANSCCLILEGEQNENGDLSDGHLWLSVGEFEPGDKDGTFLVHTTQDPKKKVSRQSKYGNFFVSAINAGVPLEARQDELGRANYVEKDAQMWVGAKLHIKVREETFVPRRGPNKGKEVTSRKPEVVEFLGWADGTSSAAAAPAAAEKPKAPTNGSGTFNFDTEAAKAENFMAYVEAGTTAGVDPGDDKLSRAYFDKVRS